MVKGMVLVKKILSMVLSLLIIITLFSVNLIYAEESSDLMTAERKRAVYDRNLIGTQVGSDIAAFYANYTSDTAVWTYDEPAEPDTENLSMRLHTDKISGHGVTGGNSYFALIPYAFVYPEANTYMMYMETPFYNEAAEDKWALKCMTFQFYEEDNAGVWRVPANMKLSYLAVDDTDWRVSSTGDEGEMYLPNGFKGYVKFHFDTAYDGATKMKLYDYLEQKAGLDVSDGYLVGRVQFAVNYFGGEYGDVVIGGMYRVLKEGNAITANLSDQGGAHAGVAKLTGESELEEKKNSDILFHNKRALYDNEVGAEAATDILTISGMGNAKRVFAECAAVGAGHQSVKVYSDTETGKVAGANSIFASNMWLPVKNTNYAFAIYVELPQYDASKGENWNLQAAYFKISNKNGENTTWLPPFNMKIAYLENEAFEWQTAVTGSNGEFYLPNGFKGYIKCYLDTATTNGNVKLLDKLSSAGIDVENGFRIDTFQFYLNRIGGSYGDLIFGGLYEVRKDSESIYGNVSDWKADGFHNLVSLSKKNKMDEVSGGAAFSNQNFYLMKSSLNAMPNTVEATIYLPKSHKFSGGVVIGNLNDVKNAAGVFNLSVNEKGNPQMLYITPTGRYLSYTFDSVDIRADRWVHLAVVRDASANKLNCYLDGTLKQSISIASFSGYIPTPKLNIGCDASGVLSSEYFAGKIRTVALFSDARTATEISSDTSSVSANADNIIAYYNFDDSFEKTVYDETANKNDLSHGVWMDYAEPVEDYAYSFAIVGDTQMVTRYYPDKLSCIYDWIVDNIDDKKIKYVFGLGDITDWDTAAEWQLAKEQIEKLDGKVGYSLVRGNHDSSGGFEDTFENSVYMNQIAGRYDDTLDNTYSFFTAGENDYMVICLDFGASDDVLVWANGLIESHPNHNVIITTHSYLHSDGTTTDENDLVPPTSVGEDNDGIDYWEKLIRKHKNIVMVLSGHISTGSIILSQDKGDNGNVVSQFLIDPQGLDFDKTIGATGLVAMFYIAEDGKTIRTQYYSTVKQKFYRLDNMFEFTLNKIDPTYGDVNDDAVVDVKDIVRLKKVFAQIEVNYNPRTADCNIDKTVDINDIVALRKKILNIG